MCILYAVMSMSDEAYWHSNRDALEVGHVFVTSEGNYVKLVRRVPGDGTKWYVADWHNGSWSYEDGTVEPGDLRGSPLINPPPAPVLLSNS